MEQLSKTYKVNAQVWHRIRQSAGNFGIAIDQYEGQGSAFGVQISWKLDQRTQELTVSIVDSGLLSPGEALNFLDGIITGCY